MHWGDPLSPTSEACLACRRSQEDQRFLFFNPCHPPFPVSHSPSWTYWLTPVLPVGAEVLSEAKGRQLRTVQVLNPGWTAAHQRGWILVPVEQNILQPSSPDPTFWFPPSVASQGLLKKKKEKSALDSAVKTSISTRKQLTWINHVQLWRLTNCPLYIWQTSHSVSDGF